MSRPVLTCAVCLMVFWLVVALQGVVPASTDFDDIDEFVSAEMAKSHVPGLSMAVVKDGHVAKAAGYGLANPADRIPVRPGTVFKIGSVSKQFIAAGIMLLSQEGRLSVDETISRFLPDSPPAWHRITLRHLLTHTSGLVREPPAFEPFVTTPDAELIRSAYSVPLRFEPGARWEYCNTGYFVLAEVIRRAAGRRWDEYLHDRIFRPLGMSETRVTQPDWRAIRARGYTGIDNREIADDWTAVRPSGAFVSTVLDLVKWDQALDDRSVLTDASVREMWRPVPLTAGGAHPYGFGWELAPFRQWRSVHHAGSLPGFRANYLKLLDERVTIILLTNAEAVDRDAILAGVIERVLTAVGRF